MKRQPKFKLRLLAFFLIFSFSIQAQSSYNDYSLSDKTFKYREDFSSSSDFWESYEPDRRSVEIEDGGLIFTSLNDKSQVKYKTIDIDWSGDWELEIGVKWLYGKESSAVDFIWDKESGISDKYHFGFTASGKYVLAEYKDSAYDHILKFVPASFVNKSTWNRMTVRKVSQTYYFFVNERLVKTMPYKPIKGDIIGFTVPPGTSIKVDYLYAFALNKNNSTYSYTLGSTASSGDDTNYNNYGSPDKTQVYREDFNNSSEKWEVYRSGSRMGKIHDGYFDWISMNSNAQLIWHTLDNMDWSRDWQIEIRMKHLTGKPNSSNDLVWNIDEDGISKYHFGFTAEGKYVFSKKVTSEYQSIVPFTSSSTVNKGGFNKVTVRKTGNDYRYFFNERLITSKSGHTVTSNKVGFMVPPNSTLQIDYLDVSYLKTSASSTARSTSGSTKLPSGKNYVAIMTKHNGYSLQRWRTRDNFPKDEIKAEWDNGYYVSDVSYDNDKWSLIMSKGTSFTAQRWVTRKEWPKDEIKEKWNEGYHITELNYGNGVWALVFSKGSSYTGQRWATKGSAFPSDKIKEFADLGFWITEIAYGDNRWALVASKDAGIRGQKWFKTNTFPENQINTYLSQGYSITQLSYENDLWVLIMTKYTSSRPQQWFVSETFPKDKIREYWGQNYYLTDITHGITGKTQELQRVPGSEPMEFSNLDQLLVGRWFGGTEDDTEEEKGYFVFDRDHITTMIANGETIGGEDYEVEGVKISLTYAVDETTSPKNFDLIFKMADSEFGRMKGIIKFIDKDTFEMQIASELSDSRPTRFTDGNQKVAIFKRVK